jgi:electron transport complex protein RnfG
MKMKSIITPVIAIAVAALVLVGSGAALSKAAAANAEKELNAMLETLLPGSTSFEMEELTGEDEGILAAYKGENGYVIQTSAYGYAGDIVMMVGVSNEGTVTGLVVRDLSETYGLGANALTDTEFLAQYLETAGDAEIGTNIDAMTGATVSSKAVTRAVNLAIAYVTGADTTSSATTWGG